MTPPPSFSAIVRAVSPESQRRVSTAIRRLSQCAFMPNPEPHRLSTPSLSAQPADAVSFAPNQVLIFAKRGVPGTNVGMVALAWADSILVLTSSGVDMPACRPMASAPSRTFIPSWNGIRQRMHTAMYVSRTKAR